MKKYFIISGALLVVVAIIMALLFGGFTANKTVALKSENYSISNSVMSYLIKSAYEEYRDAHEGTLGENYESVLGISEKKSLKRQKSPYGKSWYDYFYGIASEKAHEVLVCNEEAKLSNISLTNEEKSAVEKAISTIDYKSYSVSKQNLLNWLLLERCAEKYNESLKDLITKSDLDEYYIQNQKQFDVVDYKHISIYAGSGDGKQTAEELLNNAKKRTDTLVEDIKERGFDVAVSEYLAKTFDSKTLEELTVVNEKYKENVQFSEWAFNNSRKSGDIVVFEGKNQYSIYYLTKAPYKYDYIVAYGRLAQKHYDDTKQTQVAEYMKALEEKEYGEKGFEEFCKENGFTQVENGLLYKEKLNDVMKSWFYYADRKPQDWFVSSYGDAVYAMQFDKAEHSYFEEVLKIECHREAVEKKLKKLKETHKIEEKNLFSFVIKSKIK